MLFAILFGAMLFFLVQAQVQQAKLGVKVRADRSKTAKNSKDSKDQKLEKFSLTGFDGQGKVFWKLEGETAKIDPGQTVYLENDVTLRYKEDTVIRTNHVYYSPQTQKLETDAPVTVDHENVRVQGVGAIGRPAENYVQINRHIQMVINATTTLTCDGPMKVFYNDHKMIFYRHVKVVDAKGVLNARRMDVFFNPEAKKIEKIVAVGEVLIERGPDTTKSDRAVYTVADSSVRLEGSPEITLHKGTGLLNGTLRN